MHVGGTLGFCEGCKGSAAAYKGRHALACAHFLLCNDRVVVMREMVSTVLHNH